MWSNIDIYLHLSGISIRQSFYDVHCTCQYSITPYYIFSGILIFFLLQISASSTKHKTGQSQAGKNSDGNWNEIFPHTDFWCCPFHVIKYPNLKIVFTINGDTLSNLF
jgi:hypothetical protein